MFIFTPSYSVDEITQHVESIRKDRVTLSKSTAICDALFYSLTYPDKSKYPNILKRDEELTHEANKVWNPFIHDVEICISVIEKTNSIDSDTKNFLIEVLRKGILGCFFNDPVYRTKYMGDRLTSTLKLLKQSPDFVRIEIFKAIENFLSLTSMYVYEFTNTVDQSTNVTINGIEMQENGILYGMIIALLPMTKKAMDLTNWLLQDQENDNYDPDYSKLKRILNEKEGRLLPVKKKAL